MSCKSLTDIRRRSLHPGLKKSKLKLSYGSDSSVLTNNLIHILSCFVHCPFFFLPFLLCRLLLIVRLEFGQRDRSSQSSFAIITKLNRVK